MTSSAWSAIISGIALIAAVISPVLTTVINNHYQAKNNKRQYFDAHRAEVIENYIRYTGSVTRMSSDFDDFRQYGKYSKEIYLYLPDNLWHFVDEINDYIINKNYTEVSYTLTEFCKELNKYHPRSIKKQRNHTNK